MVHLSEHQPSMTVGIAIKHFEVLPPGPMPAPSGPYSHTTQQPHNAAPSVSPAPTVCMLRAGHRGAFGGVVCSPAAAPCGPPRPVARNIARHLAPRNGFPQGLREHP